MTIHMEPRINKHQGEDCITAAISNILQYKGNKNILKMWKQCGLFFYQDEANTARLNPRYITCEEELNWIHKINMNTVKGNDIDVVIEDIILLLQKNEPVLVYIDAYWLEHNLRYMKFHDDHCITLIDYKTDINSFVFLDDHHQIKGELAEQALKRAMDKDNNIYSYSFFESTLTNESVNEKQFFEVVETNNDSMQGNNTFLNRDYIKQEQIIQGIKSIDCYINYLEKQFKNHIVEDTLLSSMYNSLSKISNSRYLYSEFLKEGILFNNDVNQLVSLYHKAAQTWRICANICLKSTFVSNENRLNFMMRILGKLKEVKEIEIEAIHLNNGLLTGGGMNQ